MHYDGKILVPFSPESILSGVKRQLQPDELLWYGKNLFIDKKHPGKRLILHFGSVDQTCEIFINNKSVMRHIGGYLPFSADITDYVLEGGNLLTVKVRDTGNIIHSRGKQKQKRRYVLYRTKRNMADCLMEWVPDIYITSLIITPLVDESMVILLSISIKTSAIPAAMVLLTKSRRI